MSEQLQAIATLLSLINPAISGAIFSKIEAGRNHGQKTTDALKAGVALLVILGMAALFGARVLETFGISLDAFSVAGGFVLAWMGMGMIKRNSAGDSEHADPPNLDVPPASMPQGDGKPVSLTPLILFAASPGTITGVITLAVAHSKKELPVTALLAVAVAVAATTVVMLLMSIYGGHKDDGFVKETITNLMGLIVLAMGFQFALTGLQAFFA